MAYSSIKKKRCKCSPDCKLFPTMSCFGYAYKHLPEDLKEKVGTKTQLAQKRRNANNYAAAKARSLTANKEMVQTKYKNIQSNELKLWFLHRMNTYEPICANCEAIGWYLKDDKYVKLWKSCQAHLLPKRHFKSLEAHPLNGLVLGSGFSKLCHCHDTYDHDWQSASKMKIWSTVVARFKILYPLTLSEEHKYIPQVLLDTL